MVQLLDALQAAERLARVVRARQQQLAELDDPVAAEPRSGRRHPRARSAPATVQMFEVAFSRRMCCSRVCSVSTNPRRPSTSRGLAGDAAGHTAQVLLARGEETEGGTAEVEAVAERLALADGDVDAAFAGRGEDAERDRVDLGDHDRTPRRTRARRSARSPPPRLESLAPRRRAPESRRGAERAASSTAP